MERSDEMVNFMIENANYEPIYRATVDRFIVSGDRCYEVQRIFRRRLIEECDKMKRNE